MKFIIDQVALYPRDPEKAIALLREMGAEEWIKDVVWASGDVGEKKTNNQAELNFNYQMFKEEPKIELEVLQYKNGCNWMDENNNTYSVSHFGMHCSEDELDNWVDFFYQRGIPIAQEVVTTSHTNPAIAGKRRYHYAIFDTRDILGVDLKFIVRRNADEG